MAPIRIESRDSAVEVEVFRWALLEPQTVVVRRVLEELGRALEHILALASSSVSSSYSSVSCSRCDGQRLPVGRLRVAGGRLGSRRRSTSAGRGGGSDVGFEVERSGCDRRGVRGGVILGLVGEGFLVVLERRARALVPRLRRGTAPTAPAAQACAGLRSNRGLLRRPSSPVNSGPRRTGPRASRSARSISVGSAPRRRLRSRCSRIASSSKPMPLKPTRPLTRP